MLYEPCTLASVTRAIGYTLSNHYNVDPAPVFAAAGLDYRRRYDPGARVRHSCMRRLWDNAIDATGDPVVGLAVGWNTEPGDFYAFGHSWLASSSLKDALERTCRYAAVVCTSVSVLELRSTAASYVFHERYPDVSRAPHREQIDAGLTALLKMCRLVAIKDIVPLRVGIRSQPGADVETYREALSAPVSFGQDATSVEFDRSLMEEALPGAIPEVAKATDRISERYIESLDGSNVASEVRRLLVDLLPSGHAEQNTVAGRLNRSASTLQRQLQAEGVSYRNVLDETRRSLAEEYLRDGRHSHGQIAYLVGFSDQSNFSRAFKRWTGMSPSRFQSEGKTGRIAARGGEA